MILLFEEESGPKVISSVASRDLKMATFPEKLPRDFIKSKGKQHVVKVRNEVTTKSSFHRW